MLTGSLRVDKGKYYSVLNLKDEYGKRRQKKVPLHIDAVPGNKRKAEQAHRDVMAEYEAKGMTIFSKDILFHEFVVEWLESAKRDIEESTYESYLCNLNKHIIPFFKTHNILLRDMEYSHLEAYYTEKRQTLSVCTLKKHHAIIKQALRKAVQIKRLAYNPATEYKFPKSEKFKGSFLTVEQGSILLEAAEGKPIEPAIILGMLYGLRRSEIAGLRYRAIDFEANTLTIEHSVTRFVKTMRLYSLPCKWQ